ncbi:MAG TPA: VWA domain-containing protein, partial [Thermoplasmata archaeon]|nr:VWA domain-containing protein [Thermoplasmata archaeon]
LRERLRRQALRRVQRLTGEYDRRADELETVGRTEQARLDAELRALDDRLRKARSLDLSRIVDSGLLEDVSSALLVPDSSWLRPPPPPSLWDRIKAFFARIAAFFRRLFRRSAAAPPPSAARGRSLTFAVPVEGGRSLGASELGDALARMSSDQREELRGNLTKNLEAKERDVRKTAEEKRREAERQRRALEEERAEARRRAERDLDNTVRAAEQKRVDRELKERGLIAERGGQLQVTYGLVERFARLLLEDETREMATDPRMSFKGSASTGVYEKARLQRADEIAHIDLPSSLLAARMQGSKHIDESSSYVYREITSDRVHVVLAFDKSGSMAENNKLDAAKKALLALYVAIHRRHPDATIDVVAFENEVRVLDLLELWECTPGAFTNTAEALRTAHLLLQASRATRKEFFLITDGLPEAYTDDDGRVRAGQLDRAMEHALARADELATVKPLKASILLLRSTHPEYEVAARKIAERLQGELVITDPQHLGVELLIRWIGGTETVRRAPAAPVLPVPRPPPGTSKGRRRKADRRMGG